MTPQDVAAILKVVTRMILVVAAFAAIIYMLAVGSLTTGDVVSTGGIIALLIDKLIPSDA